MEIGGGERVCRGVKGDNRSGWGAEEEERYNPVCVCTEQHRALTFPRMYRT